jgi:HAE1 family hydrophobic/amphiphilic exporter-1
MQKLAEICIKRPIFASMLVLALVVVGAASYNSLGVDRFPAVDLPTVAVFTTLPGGAPEDVESEITEEIEAVVNTVEGISELRSISGSGTSIVIATFDLDRNIDVAAQDVRDRVQSVLRDLPEGTDPPNIRKFDNDSAPVLTVALSAERSIRELTELADKVVRVQLERAGGVGEVEVVGGQERAIQISLSADRLAAYGLSISEVRDAIAKQNVNIPGGNITSSTEELTLRTIGRIRDAQAFGEIVIAQRGSTPIRIRDIGVAVDSTYEQRSVARLNGVPTVILDVRRQSGANTVAVIEGAKANLERIKKQLPSDVKLEIIRDQSRYIYAALHEINLHLVLGSIFASLVVLAFMRSWRSTLIAAVAIPASVVSTFAMMWVLDFTLNSVTMLALVLMVGIVIDDAIVVLENIFRFIEEKRMDAYEAARAATAEIGLAVLATTLSLVVIFVPVSFMSSISGRFLYQFGLTAAVAILVSLLVSFTLTPMMSARLLVASGAHDPQSGEGSRSGFYGRIDRLYTRALNFSMRHRMAVAIFALLVIASSVPLYGLVKQEYIPSDVDESEFELGFTAPLTASIGAMDEVVRSIDRDLRSIRGVDKVALFAGGGFLSGANRGDGYVAMVPHEERTFSLGRLWRETLAGNPLKAFQGNYSQSEVMVEVRNKLRKYKDLRSSVRNIPSFNIGGGNWEIDFSIRGPELLALADYAAELRERAEKVGGIVDSDVTLKLDLPEQRVVIDRERAADLGVRTEDVALALRLMVGGDERVSRFRDDSVNENYDVQLRLMESDRNRLDVIERLYVPRSQAQPTATGALPAPLARLDNLVKFESAKSPSRIDRLDRQRVVSLRAGVAPGYALADRLQALDAEARKMNMPVTYSTRVMGRGRELERTFDEFIWAFGLSVIFMYMILASQFENLAHPFTILLSLPLSVPFALFSLWATGNTLNLYSALGMLVLFGVVKKNAILQVDHMNKLRASGVARGEAIIQGNRDRLRPILMTTLALVAGMLPLWAGTGPGAEERRAIAVVVIGGQTLSLVLTLLVTPVAYSLLDDAASSAAFQKLRARFSRRRSRVVESETHAT